MTDRKEASTLSDAESRRAFDDWYDDGPDDGPTPEGPISRASAWWIWQAALESRLAVGQPVAQDNGRALYVKWTDEQDIHSNRFQSWAELTQPERDEWNAKAAPDRPQESHGLAQECKRMAARWAQACLDIDPFRPFSEATQVGIDKARAAFDAEIDRLAALPQECATVLMELVALKDLKAPKWIPVSERMPPCDGERVFVGVNSAGYAACFNHINPDGICIMGSAEACTAQMSELAFWYELKWPIAAHEQWRNIQRRAMGSTTSREAP